MGFLKEMSWRFTRHFDLIDFMMFLRAPLPIIYSNCWHGTKLLPDSARSKLKPNRDPDEYHLFMEVPDQESPLIPRLSPDTGIRV